MLVLSRTRDQSVMIGDSIEVTVVDIRGDKVRLGINAPPEVPVHRREVYDAIKREGGVSLAKPSPLKTGMLVLSRQRDQEIKIGDDITITVVDIRGDKVRLGFDAPPEISLHRKEVYLAIKRESEPAPSTEPESHPDVSPPCS